METCKVLGILKRFEIDFAWPYNPLFIAGDLEKKVNTSHNAAFGVFHIQNDIFWTFGGNSKMDIRKMAAFQQEKVFIHRLTYINLILTLLSIKLVCRLFLHVTKAKVTSLHEIITRDCQPKKYTDFLILPILKYQRICMMWIVSFWHLFQIIS